jgi:hypothetical protein
MKKILFIVIVSMVETFKEKKDNFNPSQYLPFI